MLTRWRRRALRRAATPAEWRPILAHIPLYQRLPAADREELEMHMRIFLAEKHFEGVQDLVVTLEMQLRVAVSACVLLLHRKTDYYPALRTILLYPTAFVAPRKERREWIESEWSDVLTGESWGAGVVILSWDDVQASDTWDDGANLVIHEFAHQLDEEDGTANGAPPFASRDERVRWATVFTREYDALRAAVARGEDSFLDPYGAEAPPEFFAVVTEAFFERGAELRLIHPDLYDALQRYFQQDPANWPVPH